MPPKTGTPLEQQIHSIIARVTASEEQANLERFLINVMIFIKQARGEELTINEKKFKTVPFFAHYLSGRGSEAADALQRRLDIIDYYQITDAQRITNIITSTSLGPLRPAMTPRKIQIILELYNNPYLPKYELAKRFKTTPRTISKALNELRRDFALRTLTFVDPHKFKLTQYSVIFRTKSLKASEKLEQHFQRNRPRFLRQASLDHDYRQGYLIYFVPDQPRGLQVFKEKIRTLHREFFAQSYMFQLYGQETYTSFDAYDTTSGSWMFESNTISEAIFEFIGQSPEFPHIPQHGFTYSEPTRFDKVDFLLAQTGFVDSGPDRINYRYDVLKQFGFDLKKKTIWSRERNLKQKKIFFPSIYFQIPGFEELVACIVRCSPEAGGIMRRLASILPYCLLNLTNIGVFFLFQRPTHCGSMIEQLLAVIRNQPGVEDVHILQLPPSIGAPMIIDAVDRWDESRQRWLIQEIDF